MHLGRFNAAVMDLQKYFENLGAQRKIDQALAQLQPYISNRSASNLVVFRNLIAELVADAEQVPSAFHLPSVMQIHEDLKVDGWLGKALAERIRKAVKTDGLLPEEIIEKLTAARDELSAVVTDMSSLGQIMERRGVEIERLEAEAGELGISFPKPVVGEAVADLLGELQHVDRLFSSIKELTTQSRDSPKVRTISSSWWQFFVELDANAIVVWTLALERIIGLLKSNAELKKIAKDLEAKRDLLPDNMLELLSDQISTNIKLGVAAIARDIRSEFSAMEDKGRENELEVELKQELLHLVRRLNEGAALEIRAFEPPDDVVEDNAETNEARAQARALAVGKNEHLAQLSGQSMSIDLRQDLRIQGPGDGDFGPEATPLASQL